MKLINQMSESEAKALLHVIASKFGIGQLARDASTIMTNAENAAAHAFCIKSPSQRVVELADRLVAPGEKCCEVSASECQEIRQYIVDAAGIGYDSGEGDE